MAINPRIRTALTHAGTALGGAVAVGTFLSTKHVDLYAIWDQVNSIVAAVTTLIATVTPIATTAYGIYKAGTAQKLKDIVADPQAPKIASEMPVTPQTVAVAEALKA
jgi:hypothetical protein